MVLQHIKNIIKFPFKELKGQLVAENRWTTFDYGHRHSWKKGAKYTSWNAFHNHKINEKKKLAMLGGIVDHIYRLK